MKLTLGFSPCPNDTYIFDALVHGKIDTEGLGFEVILDDVEALNQKALNGELDITKLSYHAYTRLLDTYYLLDAGSALGNNCGPLLIAKNEIDQNQLPTCSVAIPGELTTANFLLNYYNPSITNKKAVLFSDIEKMILDGEKDLGLIIHENRFTYMDKGLVKLADLGQHWEESTGFPIPLGGITIHKRIDSTIQQKVNRLIRKSIEYANGQAELPKYVRDHAQEMDENVMQQHIDLYVNDFSISLGEKGREAIKKMLEVCEVASPLRVIK